MGIFSSTVVPYTMSQKIGPGETVSDVSDWEQFSPNIQKCNRDDEELCVQQNPNKKADHFLKVNRSGENIPGNFCWLQMGFKHLMDQQQLNKVTRNSR